MISECVCPSSCHSRDSVFAPPCNGGCGCVHCKMAWRNYLQGVRPNIVLGAVTITEINTLDTSRDVFLVILEDRHHDPDISVFTTRSAADECFDAWKTDYLGYEWEDEEINTEHWVRCERTDDDGPKLRIEWHALCEGSYHE